MAGEGDSGAAGAPGAPADAGLELPPGEAGGEGEGGPPLMRPPPVKATQAKRDPASGKFLRRGGGTTEVEAEAEQEEAKPQRFKRKLKIDGKEEEHEATEDELWAAHRERSTVKRRFEEAAKLRKEAEDSAKKSTELTERLKKSPMKVLRELGYTSEQALDILSGDFEEQLAEDEKSPAQRELEALRREKAEAAKAEAARGKEASTREEEAAFAKEADEDALLIGEALKLSKLPKDDLTFEVMAKAFYSNKRNGIGLTHEELAKATTAQIGSHIDGLLSSMDDDGVLDAFPKASKRIALALKARYAKKSTGGGLVRPRVEAPPRQKDGPRIVTDREMDVMFGIRRRQG